jgi:FkbM family methyltransferase
VVEALLGGRQRARALGRILLRSVCRLPVRGRYLLEERLAGALMPDGLVPARVGPAARIRCDLRDEVQRLIYYGLYDPDESALLPSLLKDGDVFLDVGANVGYYTLLASQLVGAPGAVHAFEPVPGTFAVLARNVADARLANVHLNPKAVSDGTADRLVLYVPRADTSTGWASIQVTDPSAHETVSIEAISLDRYVERAGIGRVALVKMDIEGAEPQALRGGAALFASPDAPDLLAEVNPFVLRRVRSGEDELIGLLRGFGYELFEIGPKRLKPWTASVDDRVRNVLATKRGRPPGAR